MNRNNYSVKNDKLLKVVNTIRKLLLSQSLK